MKETREKLRVLLKSGSINLIIGYGENLIPVVGESNISTVSPLFISKEEYIERLVWNRQCIQNLTVYLTKGDIKRYDKIAVFVKPCDLKAINVLCQENQINRQKLYIIGLQCDGTMAKKMGMDEGHLPAKCILCLEKHKGTARCEPAEVDLMVESIPEGERPKKNPGTYRILEELKGMPPKQRLSFWKAQFQKCLRCYACRSVCPMCYCEQCICNMSQPQWIYKSPHLKGNFLFHIIRAYHLAGRCVGCGECERVCPMGIPLMLLNTFMSDLVKDLYNYEAGQNPEDAPLLSQFKADDDQSFIQ